MCVCVCACVRACLYLSEPEIHVQTAPELREDRERVGNLLLLIRLARNSRKRRGDVRRDEHSSLLPLHHAIEAPSLSIPLSTVSMRCGGVVGLQHTCMAASAWGGFDSTR